MRKRPAKEGTSEDASVQEPKTITITNRREKRYKGPLEPLAKLSQR